MFRDSVSISASTDNIGRSFTCELVDKILEELRYILSKDEFKLLAKEYITDDSVMSCLDINICYSNSADIPEGESFELKKETNTILALDVAHFLCEAFKKSQQSFSPAG